VISPFQNDVSCDTALVCGNSAVKQDLSCSRQSGKTIPKVLCIFPFERTD
jgi:hypothetical protein